MLKEWYQVLRIYEFFFFFFLGEILFGVSVLYRRSTRNIRYLMHALKRQQAVISVAGACRVRVTEGTWYA